MTICIIIYVISLIGVILSIRYDDILFDERSWTLFLLFCPVVNTILVTLELFFLVVSLFEKIIHLNLDRRIYKLIRLGRDN